MLEEIERCRKRVSAPLYTRFCVYTSSVDLDCLKRLIEYTEVDDDWLRSHLSRKFFDYINSRLSLKTIFFIAARSRDKTTIEECLLLYNCTLYFYLFYKYFPRCDSSILDIAYRRLRKDALLVRLGSHYRVVEYTVKRVLEKPFVGVSFCDDLYKRFVDVKNALNQILKGLAKVYYQVCREKHSYL